MPRKVKYYSPKRRAVYAAGEDIDHLTVFERDGWICGICKGPVDRRLRKQHPRRATLDHIVPISICLATGWIMSEIHTHANVQLAHYICNIAKSCAVDTEPSAIEC